MGEQGGYLNEPELLKAITEAVLNHMTKRDLDDAKFGAYSVAMVLLRRGLLNDLGVQYVKALEPKLLGQLSRDKLP